MRGASTAVGWAASSMSVQNEDAWKSIAASECPSGIIHHGGWFRNGDRRGGGSLMTCVPGAIRWQNGCLEKVLFRIQQREGGRAAGPWGCPRGPLFPCPCLFGSLTGWRSSLRIVGAPYGNRSWGAGGLSAVASP